MTQRAYLEHRLALGLVGDVAGLAELDRRRAAELAELDRQIAVIKLERARWAVLLERLAGGSTLP